jgi:hypothetical protein
MRWREHARGVRGLLGRMQGRTEPEQTMERPQRIDRGGARRLLVSTGGSPESGESATPAPDAPRGDINHRFWRAKATYAVVVGGLMVASVHGPQHAWSSSGLLGSPPGSGAGDKESRMISKMSAVGVVSMIIASQADAGDAVQWRVEDGGNGHWYQAKPLEADCWDQSRLLAQKSGGYLATITSSSENLLVFALVQPFSGSNVSIGGYFDSESGSWRWVSGEAWQYTNWQFGEPGCCAPNEWWLDLNMVTGEWRDRVQCISPPPPFPGIAVVEWSADCNGDAIVDYGQCHDGTLPDYDGNNIPDCCERGEVCVVGSYPVQWRAEQGGNGHWYLLKTQQTGIDWSNANSFAASVNGRLGQIESAVERQFLFDLSAASIAAWNRDAGGALGPWLGGWQQSGAPEPNGGWIWTDGSPVDFAICNLVNSDPSGCGTNENRMSFWCKEAAALFPGSVAYETSDYPAGGICGSLGPIRAALIEWSADCNHDNIVDYGQILLGQLPDTNANGIPDGCEEPTCRDVDLFRDGTVNGADLGILLAQWGVANANTVSDINRDGRVDGSDLGTLLAFWGPCPK